MGHILSSILLAWIVGVLTVRRALPRKMRPGNSGGSAADINTSPKSGSATMPGWKKYCGPKAPNTRWPRWTR